MNPNPYKDSETAPAPPPTRWPSIKSRILWFALGFFAHWTIWTVLNYRALSPRDYTQTLPEELREGQPEWMKDAKGRRVGQFTIIAASHPKQASAQVSPTLPNRNPGVGYEDTDSDGRVDLLRVSDAKFRVFEFVVVDGSFQSYEYTPDLLAPDSVSFDDYDMDGRFDYRFGPGRRSALMVDSQWHNLVSEGNYKGYVEIDGARIPAECVNGMWRIVE
ncbi:MAG TPA: VCBS repeat-containing protein [Pirellulaceae bacterium]|nr:VCBS repeat-containing protein [Pirellulaceae bacterium]